MGRRLIGHVAVDSGTLMIVDPCYVLQDNQDATNATLPHYEQFLEAAGDKNLNAAPIEPFGNDFGIIFGTLYGDGTYPVYADVDAKGRTLSITVDLGDGDEDDY